MLEDESGEEKPLVVVQGGICQIGILYSEVVGMECMNFLLGLRRFIQ